MGNQGIDCKAVCRDCLADIEGIYELFNQGRCRNIDLARQRMAELKAIWKERIRQGKGTDVESVVSEAFTRISVKSTSVPDHQWTSDLYSARIDLDFYLGH